MAIADQKFQEIIDIIEQTVKDTIATELSKQPQKSLPPLFDLDEFREQLLESVRDELRVFKEELVTELSKGQTPTSSTSVVATPKKQESFWEGVWRGVLGEYLWRKLNK